MKALKIAGAVILLTALVPLSSWAQPGPRRDRDRARTFLVVRLAEALELSDEKALQISRIFRDGDKRRQDLASERRGLEGEIRAALDAQSAEAELSKLVARANAIDAEIAMIPDKSLQEMQKILSVEEQAKLVLFRPKLRDEVRGALRDRLGRRSDRPGRPGPPPERPE